VQFPYYDLNFTSPNLTGETVYALGSPAGYQGSVSMGILSAKNRTFSVEGHVYTDLIQTDAAINPGNSGGPLVDQNGALVGINSAKLAGEAIESIGFAIPNDIVVTWVNDAIAVARGDKAVSSTAVSPEEALRQRFGIKLTAINEDQANALNIESGLAVSEVEGNSPAEQAEIQAGNVIISIDNHPITDAKSLPRELLKKRTGDRVRFGVVQFRSLGMFIESRGRAVTLVAR
jgi:serine protease Do